MNAIKDWWEKNGEKVINKVVSTMKALWKVLKQVFGKIQKIAEKVWGVVKDIVIDAVTAIQAFWAKNGGDNMGNGKDVVHQHLEHRQHRI